jgi:hypothetical protein
VVLSFFLVKYCITWNGGDTVTQAPQRVSLWRTI